MPNSQPARARCLQESLQHSFGFISYSMAIAAYIRGVVHSFGNADDVSLLLLLCRRPKNAPFDIERKNVDPSSSRFFPFIRPYYPGSRAMPCNALQCHPMLCAILAYTLQYSKTLTKKNEKEN